MSLKKTTEQFVKEASAVHKEKYDYSKTSYKTAVKKVTITCPIHGDFEQRANSHLNGNGCKKCGIEKAHKSTTMSTETFIERSKKRHGNKYDYSKTAYRSTKEKVTIICPKHEEFDVLPSVHLRGSNCPKCASGNRVHSSTKDNILFTEEANSLHADKYLYKNFVYINNKTKSSITCPEHGDFQQTPNSHLSGQGCPKCATANQGWTYSQWEKQGKESQYFDSFKLYIVKCTKGDEAFIKIGKTFQTVGRRFQDKTSMPYLWELVHVSQGDARTMSILESKLHSKFKHFSYSPKFYFGGFTECFTLDILPLLKKDKLFS